MINFLKSLYVIMIWKNVFTEVGCQAIEDADKNSNFNRRRTVMVHKTPIREIRKADLSMKLEFSKQYLGKQQLVPIMSVL